MPFDPYFENKDVYACLLHSLAVVTLAKSYSSLFLKSGSNAFQLVQKSHHYCAKYGVASSFVAESSCEMHGLRL